MMRGTRRRRTEAFALGLATTLAAAPAAATDRISPTIGRSAELSPSSPIPSARKAPPAVARAIVETARRYAGAPGLRRAGLDGESWPALFEAVIWRESAFDARAVSVKGAMGLGQLMPATAAALGVADPFDPVANLDGSARYLTAQLDRFGDVRLGLAAYNAGAEAVVRYRGVPPFLETQAYVAAIEARLGDRVRPQPVASIRSSDNPSNERAPWNWRF